VAWTIVRCAALGCTGEVKFIGDGDGDEVTQMAQFNHE
jgi:hypothetical protein